MIVGTRGSQLALAQTKQVCADLSKITGESIDVEIIKTKGDKITTSQLYNMDSKGLFTKELDIALLEEEVDFTVHSFKDLPTELDEDLEIVAVPKREAPNEVLISKKDWNELGPGLEQAVLEEKPFVIITTRNLNSNLSEETLKPEFKKPWKVILMLQSWHRQDLKD